MMEHNTDRLFWTLTSIIVGALLLTISVKAFPGITNTVTAPFSGLTKQADTSTKTSDQAYKDAINGVNGSSSNNNNSQSSKSNDPEAQAKANAAEASTLNLSVTPNGDGTGVLAGPASGTLSGNLNIPKYVKVNGQLTKITSIGQAAFENNNLTSVTIPDGVTDIAQWAFYGNQLTSVNIPDSVTNIEQAAFNNNQLNGIVNIPNSQGYQSVVQKSNALYRVFDSNVTLTNNSSSQNSQLSGPDAKAKLTAVEADMLSLSVTPNGDGTGVLTGLSKQFWYSNLDIPKYVKVNGQLTKITSIGDNALSHNILSSLSIPNSVTSIGANAFSQNALSSVTIPNSVTNIGNNAFAYNQLKSVNIPNQQGYQSAQSNTSFYGNSGIRITNSQSN